MRASELDVNDNGQIAGTGYLNGLQRAFLITDNDGTYGNGGAVITNLGVLPSGHHSSADGINSAGKVVGYSSAKWGELHAFLYSGGVMTDIKTLGGPTAWAFAINDADQVVGRSLTQKNNWNNDDHAFLWQNGRMNDLNKFRPRGSIGTLDEATDINNKGQIVGEIRFGPVHAPTHYHAFLMVPGAPLQAESVSTQPVTQTIGMDQAQSLLGEAIARWQAAGADTSAFANIDIHIADLGVTTLGLASSHTLWLDADAAGWGWFVDPTPREDSEFTTPGDQGEQNRMDLLTALVHEIGHLLGQEHADDGVMIDTLVTGIRRMPGSEIDWLTAVDLLFGETSPDKRRR